MKRILLVSFFMIGLLFFTGCNYNNKNAIDQLKEKIKKLDCYQIDGTLEVTNNETTYAYDINVAYEKDEKYRVSLKNKTNDHEQIILKNSSGVYVLTPSLNKSFKFQSEWPYNNSQSYLYQTILNDIENDNEASIKNTKNGYIITTKVNYSNNKNLVNQKIYLNKNYDITEVEVLDKNEIVKIKMKYDKVDQKACFDKDYFELSNNLKVSEEIKEQSTASIDNIVYPLYIPDNTTLKSQDTISTSNGDRVILTFSGDNPFTLIEEPVVSENNQSIISVSGDLEFVNDTIGSIDDGMVSWISNGIEYYAVTDSMDTKELLEVANSVSVLPVGK